tara:strand:- start:1432 stop:2682 length:1251 start_codon:yes stop_codon:yes gene_type:complete
MSDIIRNIKGTKDILFDETSIWIYLENYIHKFFSNFGYKEIRTPSFENTELFLRSIGEDTDIVSKEMYSWIDQGNNKLTLRPELTASVSRSYIQHQLSKQQKSHKFYYLGSSYRRERPQKGRFRQFKQFGIEAFGSEFPEQDAEIISMAYLLYDSLNIKNLKLRINSIGSKEDRKIYIKKLRDYFSKFDNQLTATSKKRLVNNPLRILDTKVDFEIDLVKNAPKIIDFISLEDKEHFQKLLNILENLNIPYLIDDYLVRGLDYYSRTVFEIQTDSLGSQNALCGGGRYDYLVEELGGPDTPAIGFAAGLERLIIAADLDNQKVTPRPDIYIIAINDEAVTISLKLANQLRVKKNLIVINDTLQRSLKAQMKDANRLKVKYSIIIGDEELNKKQVSIKNMDTGNQEALSINQVVEYF